MVWLERYWAAASSPPSAAQRQHPAIPHARLPGTAIPPTHRFTPFEREDTFTGSLLFFHPHPVLDISSLPLSRSPLHGSTKHKNNSTCPPHNNNVSTLWPLHRRRPHADMPFPRSQLATFPPILAQPPSMSAKVIVVGGGLSGLSAAHTVLERGGNVVSSRCRCVACEICVLTPSSAPPRQELVHGCK
jgi:hypothetical protein